MRESIFGKETPEWFLEGSVYQINPRTFTREGTLTAITRELPFLAELGFTVIYLCPIFEADPSLSNRSPRQLASSTDNPKNPYRMNDFFTIDEEYGTMDDLRELIRVAHGLSLKVFLDLVYLHIGPNARILERHPEFVIRDGNGDPVLTKWNFPRLKFGSPGLREYLYSNMTYYVGVLDVDGFRCDVADQVPLDFWAEGRRRIRAIKKDAVLINEGVKKEYLLEAFDADYAFGWHDAIRKAITERGAVNGIRENYRKLAGNAQQGFVFLRDMDNHDTVTDWPSRTEVLVGHAGMEMISALNYVIDGVPMVYCGNELGDTARLNMFANRFYPGAFEFTDRSDAAKSTDFSKRRQSVIRTLNRLKAERAPLAYGDTAFVETSADDTVLALQRSYQGESVLFIGSFADAPVTVTLSVVGIRGATRLLESESPVVLNADGSVTLPAYGYAVIWL